MLTLECTLAVVFAMFTFTKQQHLRFRGKIIPFSLLPTILQRPQLQ